MQLSLLFIEVCVTVCLCDVSIQLCCSCFVLQVDYVHEVQPLSVFQRSWATSRSCSGMAPPLSIMTPPSLWVNSTCLVSWCLRASQWCLCWCWFTNGALRRATNCCLSVSASWPRCHPSSVWPIENRLLPTPSSRRFQVPRRHTAGTTSSVMSGYVGTRNF